MIHLEERGPSDPGNTKKLLSAYVAGSVSMANDIPNSTNIGPVKSAARRSAGLINARKGSVQPKQVNELTKEERQIIKDTEDEYKRRGSFKRVFPTIDFLYYKQFFEEVRPMNYFLDA